MANQNLPGQAKRSTRYPIRVPLRYRIKGERKWNSGTTINMSDSGILFEGKAPLEVGTHFSGQLTLPARLSVKTAGYITFHAAVVRNPHPEIWAGQISGVGLRRSLVDARSGLSLTPV